MKQERLDLKSNKGMTLVEMLISFMLLGIFIVAASQIISSTTMIYCGVRDGARGAEVSEIVLSKAGGMLVGAQKGSDDMIPAIDSDTTKTSGTSISFYDRTGTHVKIGVNDDGYLNIYYYPIPGRYKERNWTFDKDVYMGYTITDFLIEKVDMGPLSTELVYKISMTLHASNGIDYPAVRYVKCYNYADFTAGIPGTE